MGLPHQLPQSRSRAARTDKRLSGEGPQMLAAGLGLRWPWALPELAPESRIKTSGRAVSDCKHQAPCLKARGEVRFRATCRLAVLSFARLASYCCCSVAKSCLTHCDLMGCSMPGFPVLTISWSLPKFISIESVMLSNHLILYQLPLLLPSVKDPASGSFPVRWLLASGGQSIGASG